LFGLYRYKSHKRSPEIHRKRCLVRSKNHFSAGRRGWFRAGVKLVPVYPLTLIYGAGSTPAAGLRGRTPVRKLSPILLPIHSNSVLLHCDVSAPQTYILDETFGILFGHASTSFLVKGIIVGFLVIFIAFAAGAYIFTSHRVLLLAASVFDHRFHSPVRPRPQIRNLDFLPTS
jgi:hypothetical protein